MGYRAGTGGGGSAASHLVDEILDVGGAAGRAPGGAGGGGGAQRGVSAEWGAAVGRGVPQLGQIVGVLRGREGGNETKLPPTHTHHHRPPARCPHLVLLAASLLVVVEHVVPHVVPPALQQTPPLRPAAAPDLRGPQQNQHCGMEGGGVGWRRE